MLEAHCYEWALVIAIILQDTMSSTAALQSVFQDQDMSVDNKRHVATGLEQLMAWAQTERSVNAEHMQMYREETEVPY